MDEQKKQKICDDQCDHYRNSKEGKICDFLGNTMVLAGSKCKYLDKFVQPITLVCGQTCFRFIENPKAQRYAKHECYVGSSSGAAISLGGECNWGYTECI